MDTGTEFILGRFAPDTKLRKVASDIPDSYAATQREINGLKKWTEGNLMQFNRKKCKILPLVRNALVLVGG